MRTYNTILTELRPVLADVKGGDRDPAKVARLRALTTEAAEAKGREQADGDELLAALAGGMKSGPVEGKRLTRAGLKSTAAALAISRKFAASSCTPQTASYTARSSARVNVVPTNAVATPLTSSSTRARSIASRTIRR